MKKRNRVRRQLGDSARKGWLSLFSESTQPRRKSWMFERLEERYMFTATPAELAGGAQVFNGVLSEEQVTMGEMWWAFKQAANLNQYTQEQLNNTTEWNVWLVDPSSGNGSGSSFNPYLSGSSLSVLDTSGLSTESVIAQLSSADNVVAFYPNVGTGTASTMSAIDEPLFESQWHLRNTGQKVGTPSFQDLIGKPGEDINVVGAWNQGYSGNGVVVGVVDSGFETTHPDLFDNYRADLSTNFSFSTGPGSHGTAVAGLIGADGNNHYGTVGVAYDADLVNLRIGSDNLLDGINTDAGLAEVLSYRNDVIQIYSNSWGFQDPNGRTAIPLGPLSIQALRNAIRFGRPDDNGNPLGNIFVFASGNSAGHDLPPAFPSPGGLWDSANYNALINRYTIGVGGVDHDGTEQNVDGTFTDYPETGANVLVVAPTGSVGIDIAQDTDTGSGIWTTDLTGNAGYNAAGSADGDFLSDPNFTSRFSGTSAATPIVSGVIALMLEANPNLNYRDVQEILLRSARQNDKPSDNPSQPSQSSAGWQTNYIEPFQPPAIDPMTAFPVEDPYRRLDGSGESSIAGVALMLHPIDDYSIQNLPTFTNGAGYTVNYSRGIFSEEVGWAHGVVDADLAVKLAKQWTTTGQNRPAELTYTTFVQQFGNSSFFSNSSRFGISYGGGHIPSGQLVGPTGDEDRYIIPGVMSGRGTTFGQFYDEFWNDMPFQQTDPNSVPIDDNGSPLPLRGLPGFAPPLMEIEWVEVKVEIYDADINGLRIALRSPDGTISDLNSYFKLNGDRTANFLDTGQAAELTDPAGGTNPFIWTFSTNRFWGERSDDFVEIDPATGTPRVDPDLNTLYPGFPFSAIQRQWQLIVENYSSASSGYLDTFEVVFHGKPIQGERISGHVGVDSGINGSGAGDGNFDFTREVTSGVDANNDGIDDWAAADTAQEPFASNVLVRARDSSGQIVAQFLTGADGNYYFDLAPGPNNTPADYTIEVVDPLGRTPMQDMGLNPRYQSSWQVTVDPTDAYTRTAGRQVPIDANQDGIQDFVDINMNGIRDPNEPVAFTLEPYNDADFLLDVGTQPAPEVDVSGFIYADVNGDGVYNGSDTPAPGFRVFVDANNSGAFEQGETNAFTDATGHYSFTVTGINVLQNISIIAKPISTGWTATNPIGGKQTLLRGPGDDAVNVDFGFKPPPDTDPTVPPPDPTAPGSILGSVFNDRNGNGVQNTSDGGVAGVRVFVDKDGNHQFSYTDVNTNGVYDTGDIALEPNTVTNEFGGFFLTGIDPGLVDVYIVVPANFALTSPSPVIGFRQVTLIAGGIVNNVKFGIHNLATADFGDLPNSYKTTLASNGPRHEIIAGFQLGTKIDGEQDGQPTADAKGDDAVTGDEDGVTLLGAGGSGTLVPGVTNSVQVSLSGVGGYLNAWMDFNRDGDFDDAGEHVIVDSDLNPGLRTVAFAVPSNMVGGPIAARFRWGTAGLNYFGTAIIGEVEDYFLPNSVSPPVSSAVPGDYDSNGTVNQLDYNFWKSNFGSTSNLAADGNHNGVVDLADYTVWRDHLGQSGGAGSGGGSGAVEAASLVESSGVSAPAALLSDVGTSAPVEAAVSSPLLIPVGYQFSTTVSQTSSSGFVPLASAVASSGHDAAALQLLDSALAAIGSDHDDQPATDPLSGGGSGSQDEDTDLTLAAVFGGDTDWRYSL